jgi:hypothetical protein
MAKFDEHCLDCERLLGNRHEDVNRWMDEFFRTHGPKHRRFRHCWHGVRQAEMQFGLEGAQAAIIHIVRDCGRVPRERDYDIDVMGLSREGTIQQIIFAPEYLLYDSLDESAREKFNNAVKAEIRIWGRSVRYPIERDKAVKEAIKKWEGTG